MSDIESYEDLIIDVPEPDHVETVVQGFIETLEGTESYNTRYLKAVMQSAGLYIPARDGNESFFSAIGDGIKKAWEYIKKMFQSIWGFFFGKKEAKKQIEEAKEKAELIKEVTQKIKSDPVKMKAVVKHMAKAASNTQTKIEDIPTDSFESFEAFMESDDKSKVVNTGKKIIDEFLEQNKEICPWLKNKSEEITNIWNKVKDKLDAERKDPKLKDNLDLFPSQQAIVGQLKINNLNLDDSRLRNAINLEEFEKVASSLLESISSVEGFFKKIENEKSTAEEEISKIEKELEDLNHRTSQTSKFVTGFHTSRLESLKHALTNYAMMIKAGEQILTITKQISDKLTSILGTTK